MSAGGRRRRYRALDGAASPAIRLAEVGFQPTGPGFAIGPRELPLFGLTWVASGDGWASQGGNRVEVEDGDAFITFPGTTYAFAAGERPWDVYWLGFSAPGLAARLRRAGLTPRSFLRKDCDRTLFRQTFERLLRLAARPGPGTTFALLADVWLLIAALVAARAPTARPAAPGLASARRYIDEHLAEPLSIETLARKASLSRFHFMRSFKRAFGRSPLQYQIARRMEEAKRLLATGASVTSTARRVGCPNLFYFSRLFRDKCGVPPSTFVRTRLVMR